MPKLKVWEIIVSDKKLFLVMIIDRGEDICFYHFVIINVYSTLSAVNVGIYMNSSS